MMFTLKQLGAPVEAPESATNPSHIATYECKWPLFLYMVVSTRLVWIHVSLSTSKSLYRNEIGKKVWCRGKVLLRIQASCKSAWVWVLSLLLNPTSCSGVPWEYQVMAPIRGIVFLDWVLGSWLQTGPALATADMGVGEVELVIEELSGSVSVCLPFKEMKMKL